MSFRKISILLLCLGLLATPAFARVMLGGITVGVGYTYVSGPGFYGYPYYYDPFWGPYPWFGPALYAFPSGRPMGEVRLAGTDNRAEVYIDGGYAGVVKDLKRLQLDPGAYTFEVREQGKAAQQRRVYVISNKTVKIDFSKEQR
jgi:hypothetical protein